MHWREVPVRAWFATLALGVFGLVAVGMELQHLLRLAPCPLCIFQRLLYLVIGLVALAGVLLPGGRLLWSAMIAALAAGGVAVAGYQTWMQAFPLLATECGYSDPNLIERLVRLAGYAVAGSVPGHRLLHQPRMGVPRPVDGQLVVTGIRRDRWLRSVAHAQQTGVAKKQNPPEGGFVESWSVPNYFSFTSL